MKMRKEYLILCGIIAVLLIYLIFSSGKNKMGYEVPKVNKIDQGEINKIEISKAGVTISLSGKMDKWKILPQEYPADQVKVKDILEAIENLTLTELAAEKGDFQRYELDDDQKIRVSAYNDDQILREYDIGKISSTYRHTFVRLANDTKVYYARNSFRSHFEHEIKDLRDKIVMTFDKNEITALELSIEENNQKFTKTLTPAAEEPKEESQEGENQTEKPEEKPTAPKQEENWALPDGKIGKKSEIDSLLSQLSDLRCDEYLEGKNKEEFTDPLYSVSLTGIKAYTLKIFQKQEGENGKYPAVSSENAYIFLLSVSAAERIMKKPEDLLPEDKTETSES